MGFSMIFWIVILVILIMVVVNLLSKNQSPNLSAKQILELRYAKGEIDKQEFDRRMDDLGLK